MKNNIDFLELLAKRRQVCRLHINNIDIFPEMESAFATLDNTLQTFIQQNPHDADDKYYIYVGRDFEHITEAASFDRKGDHQGVGALYGYPICCINSFCNHREDIISENDDDDYQFWQPAFTLGQDKLDLFDDVRTEHIEEHVHDVGHCELTNTFNMLMNPELNLLAHFPCSLDCPQSINIAQWRAQFKYNFNQTTSNYVHGGSTFIFSDT